MIRAAINPAITNANIIMVVLAEIVPLRLRKNTNKQLKTLMAIAMETPIIIQFLLFWGWEPAPQGMVVGFSGVAPGAKHVPHICAIVTPPDIAELISLILTPLI
jgi:hypothetical protein